MRLRLSNVPTRLATGGYVLHSGLAKRHADDDTAKGLYGLASGAFPALKKVEPATFVKVLSAAEITVGSLLLAPFIPNWVAGAALSGFAGSLVTMYLRTPALHQPGSVWPTPDGIAISKDSWMLSIGLGLILQRACRSSD